MKEDYTHAAILEFDDLAGLKAYLEHPAHAELAARFFECFEQALMYDFDMRDGRAGLHALIEEEQLIDWRDGVGPASEPAVASAGWSIDRSRSILAPHRRSGRAIRPDGQIAVLLIQERMEALVVGRWQAEHAEQRTIAPTSVFETAMDQRRKIISRQLVRLERLVHDRPEVFAGDQPIPQSIGGAGPAFQPARGGSRFVVEADVRARWRLKRPHGCPAFLLADRPA